MPIDTRGMGNCPSYYLEDDMKERIKDKLTKHIESILAKDTLTFEDYQILSNEIYKLELKEKNKELEDANAKRAEALRASLDAMIN